MRVIKLLPLSIITLSNNSLSNLKRTYQSLNEQKSSSLKFVEWIIVDNNSNDGTSEFINSIIEKNLRIIFKSEPDKGIYDAMNKGFFLCNSENLIFLNSGDTFYSKNTLEFVLNYTNNFYKKKIIFFGANRIFSKNNKYISKKRFPKPISYINWGMPTNHQSIIYPTTLFKEIKFNDKFKIAGDYDHLCRCYRRNYPMEKCNTIISNFYMDGISNQSIHFNSATKEVLHIKKHVLKQNFLLIFAFKIINFIHVIFSKLYISFIVKFC